MKRFLYCFYCEARKAAEWMNTYHGPNAHGREVVIAFCSSGCLKNFTGGAE